MAEDIRQIGAYTDPAFGEYSLYEMRPGWRPIYYSPYARGNGGYKEYIVWVPWTYYLTTRHTLQGRYASAYKAKTVNDIRCFPMPNGLCMGRQQYNTFEETIEKYWSRGFNHDGGWDPFCLFQRNGTSGIEAWVKMTPSEVRSYILENWSSPGGIVLLRNVFEGKVHA